MGVIGFVEASTTGAGELANRIAREAGHRVILFTRDASGYDDAILDGVEVVSCETRSGPTLAEIVHPSMALDAVATTADLFVPQASYLAQSLGLPGLSYEAALSARNKRLMRERLSISFPELNPAFVTASTLEEALSFAGVEGYPFVAKPADSNDGEDVELIRDEGQLRRYLERWTQSGRVQSPLLEGYVEGPEFSVETVQAADGPLQLIGVTVKYCMGLDRDHFVESGHAFPLVGDEVVRLFDSTRRALGALGLNCGVMHTECRIGADGVKIVEINPRLAGGKIGSHLVELSTGKSAVRAVVDVAFGSNVQWDHAPLRGAALYSVWSEHRGRFCGIRNSESILREPGVEYVLELVQRGSECRTPVCNRDILATVICVGESAAHAYERASRAASQLELDIAPG